MASFLRVGGTRLGTRWPSNSFNTKKKSLKGASAQCPDSPPLSLKNRKKCGKTHKNSQKSYVNSTFPDKSCGFPAGFE
jgi:hypothetical protein